MRLLRAFFTPEDVELALRLNFIPEPLRNIARRTKRMGLTPEETQDRLQEMLHRGLLNHGRDPKTGAQYYGLAPLAVGFYEYRVDALTREMAEAYEEYMPEAFIDEYVSTGIPQIRTIPLETAITPEHHVAAYDDLRQLVETIPGPWAVAECICTQEKELMGHTCKHTLRRRCLANSQWYLDEGHAERITKEEALAIIREAEEEGLVIQPGNAKQPGFICLCCGDCCGILTRLKTLPDPSVIVTSNYYSEVDAVACSGCGTCVDRCPMDAITLQAGVEDGGDTSSAAGEVAVVERKRCIGCGVCVPTCPTGAVHLVKKPTEAQTEPPKDLMDMYAQIMMKKAELAWAAKKQ